MERFHGTFRPDFLDTAQPFTTVAEAQAAVDVWVEHYNAERPHQGLDDKVRVTPTQRFKPEADEDPRVARAVAAADPGHHPAGHRGRR